MILFHTADWHIGQHFFGYDRKEEHLVFFEWLKTEIREHRPDALLIAGDVFDSPNPSAESQKIFYRLLKEITGEMPELQVVMIAGNHDSAARLEAPDPLFREMNISVKGSVKRNNAGEIIWESLLVPLKKDGQIAAWCIAVPYLRQGDYPSAETYSQCVAASYEACCRELDKIRKTGQPVIAMGHLQATGSEISENDRSERTVIGGLESVSPEAFDRREIKYTALGHLHKAQRVSGREHVRYAGSPLPMSFAEKNYKQGINKITLKDNDLDKIERLVFVPPVSLLSIPDRPQPLSAVLQEIATLPDGPADSRSPYLELKVSVTGPEPALRYRIEEALKEKAVRLTRIVSFAPGKSNHETESITYEELQAMTPLKMAEDVYLDRYGDPMPENLRKLLLHVIRDVEL